MKTKLSALLIAIVICLPTITRAQITLYGLTSEGGTNNAGTIFKCSTTGVFTKLIDFNGINGASPYGGLTKAYDGKLYGMTYEGGFYYMGNIFNITPSGMLDTVVSFNDSNGANPYGSLYQATDSNFYGMTFNGGIYSSCVCFECTPRGKVNVLFDFLGLTGDFPYGNVIQASTGNLYGMTTYGGDNNEGIIWVKIPGDTLTKIYDFTPPDGAAPYGSLIEATDGYLYGMTSTGGKYNYGTLFRFNMYGGYTKLIDFNDTNGATPYGSLIQASDGNLYGMTSGIDSSTGHGTIFRCTLSGDLTVLHIFNDSIGGLTPYGTLVQASDNNLYGMTSYGGINGFGTIFKCTLSGNFTKIFDFDSASGMYPMYEALIEVDSLKDASVPSISKINSSVNVYPNPSNGIFTISLSHAELVSASQPKIEVYGMLGERVFNETLKQVQGDNSINLSSQPAGVYLYRVLDANGNLIGDGKLIIQK